MAFPSAAAYVRGKMAKKWTPAEKQELADLVLLLFELSSFRTWEEFASAAGVHPVSISNWQSARSAPEGYNVLRLLRASGALARLQASAALSAEDRNDSRPEARTVQAILSEVRSGFEKLQQQIEGQFEEPGPRRTAGEPA